MNIIHYYQSGASLEEVETVVQERWSRLSRDTELVKEARASGIDLQALDLDGECPYLLSPAREGFGVVEAFMVALAARVAGEYAVRALDWVWLQKIMPGVKRKFGDDIAELPPPHSSQHQPDDETL